MEREVDEVVGPKGEHNPGAGRGPPRPRGWSVTLGGQRVSAAPGSARPDERELPVESYEYFADRDPFTRAVLDRMLAGVSARRFAAVGESVGEQVERSSSATAKTAVSELFVEHTRTVLEELMSRRLDDVRLAVMLLDGLEIADRTHVVALGITTDGVKIPLGLWEARPRTLRSRALWRISSTAASTRVGDPVRDRWRRPHEFRHSWESHLHAAGVDPADRLLSRPDGRRCYAARAARQSGPRASPN